MRAASLTVRLGAGFMASDMCPVSKGYSKHWMRHVWGSRVDREREEESEREAGLGISLTTVGWL